MNVLAQLILGIFFWPVMAAMKLGTSSDMLWVAIVFNIFWLLGMFSVLLRAVSKEK